MLKIFLHILLLIILLEQPLFVTPTSRMDTPLKMKNAFEVMHSLLNESNNVFHTLALKAQTKHGLTEKDKKLLAASIVDWLKENKRARQAITVYWYTRQG
jgi:hypothetical protein